MTKTIKFNLICDDKPVRTIEDLQNNFSIEDVLAYYNNKLLHRWLEVRGYTEELEHVNEITTEKPIEIIRKLIKIFKIVSDDRKIEESVYMLEFLNERQVLCSEYNKENYKVSSIIDDYQTGYRQLVDAILENPDDIAIIKANIAEMTNNYAWILQLNHRSLFYTLKNKSVLAIMCLLMNEQSRKYYFPVKMKDEDEADAFDSVTKNDSAGIFLHISTRPMYWNNLASMLQNDSASIFEDISSMITNSDFKTKFGENLVAFAGITDDYWKDLEPKGKKYMIISMGAGDFVRSAGVSGGDLSSEDTLNKFVIVDGIDYKSNSATRQLLYMEV